MSFGDPDPHDAYERALQRVRADERAKTWAEAVEACAKLCDEMAAAGNDSWNIAISAAAGEIRDLKPKPGGEEGGR